MPYCEKCGSALSNDDILCPRCGFKVVKRTPPQPQQQQAPQQPVIQQQRPPYTPSQPVRPQGTAPQKAAEGAVDINKISNPAPQQTQPQQVQRPQQVQQPQRPQQVQQPQRPQQPPVAQKQPYVPAQVPQQKPKKPVNKKVLVIIFVILAVIIAAIVALGILKSQHSPNKFANDFAKTLMAGDWEGVYDDIYIQESTFVNKETFVKMCKEDSSAFGFDVTKVKNYDVINNGKSSSKIISDYSIKCYSDGKTSTVSFTVNKDTDGFLFFDTYKISLAVSPIQDYRIYAPKGSKVTVSDIAVDKAYQETLYEGADYNYFYIDSILPGEYDVKITHDNCESYTGKIKVYNLKGEQAHFIQAEYGTKEYFGYMDDKGNIKNGSQSSNCFIAGLYYKEDYIKKIDEKSRSIIEQVTSDIVSGEYDITKYSFIDESSQESFEENMQDNIEEMSYTGYDNNYRNKKIKSIKHTDSNDDSLYAACWDNAYRYNEYTVYYSYDYCYEDYWDSSLVTEKYDKSCNASVSLSPDDNGEWKINYVSISMEL